MDAGGGDGRRLEAMVLSLGRQDRRKHRGRMRPGHTTGRVHWARAAAGRFSDFLTDPREIDQDSVHRSRARHDGASRREPLLDKATGGKPS